MVLVAPPLAPSVRRGLRSRVEVFFAVVFVDFAVRRLLLMALSFTPDVARLSALEPWIEQVA